MGNQTTAFAALATSQQIQYAVPYIDPNSLQPTLDGGMLNGIPTGGGFIYVPQVNGGPFTGVGAFSVGTAGDVTSTDPINSGGQIDSYTPTTIQNAGVVGAVPGHTVSASRGTRYIPSVIQGTDFLGEFSGYGLVSIAGVTSYQKLSAINIYAQGADLLYPGGEIRLGTRANATGIFTEWVKLSNAGVLNVSGYFAPPLLPAGATPGTFQVVSELYVCTGVPNNAAGSNGDYALRSDGGAGSCIYQKRAGAWVATGA